MRARYGSDSGPIENFKAVPVPVRSIIPVLYSGNILFFVFHGDDLHTLIIERLGYVSDSEG